MLTQVIGYAYMTRVAEVFGDQGNRWHALKVPIVKTNESEEKNFHVIIKGATKIGRYGDIALDDIQWFENHKCQDLSIDDGNYGLVRTTKEQLYEVLNGIKQE